MTRTTRNLGDEADADGGVLVVTLGELRDALGYRRLGIGVLDEIAQDLKGQGLGYLPVERLTALNDSPRQWQEVRLYRRDNQKLAQIIDAVIDPDAKGDELLRDFESSNSSAAVIQEIRKLVKA